MLSWFLRLVRMVMQQITYNMESGLWSGKAYGSSRSIVRKIGSNLPMIQSPRVHFQFIPCPVALNGSTVASFADVGWVAEEEGDAFARLRTQNTLLHSQSIEDEVSPIDAPLRRQVSLPVLWKEGSEIKPQPAANEEALQKISVLENELANLRAQIAKIVTLQEQQSATAVSSPTSLEPGSPPPPVFAAPPPPPPPPPLPPPPPAFQRSFSAIDLIKERKSNRGNSKEMDSAPKKPEIPNMLEVLKDMNSVKLRSVKRSPEEPKPCDPADPAALIAEALKKKFAFRYPNDNRSDWEKEHKEVLETPLFGPHMLKSTGKMKSLMGASSSCIELL